MKKIIALSMVLVLSFTLVGCNDKESKKAENKTTINSSNEQETKNNEKIEDTFTGLDDEDLQKYVEDKVYTELIDQLNTDEYFIENVSTTYISKEYIDELNYNSKANVYFGYTESELDQQFQGEKYVFTLGEDNKTVVKKMEEVEDYSYDKIIKNVAIGSGAILVCVTVSVMTAGAAPAVSVILATSAKTGTTMALSSGAISGISAGIIEGYKTGDFDAAVKAGMEAGSESFKWGAVTGAVLGGATEAIALKGATLNGLSMNEAAQIQKESKYPLEVIKQFKSVEEFNVYKDAGLVSKMVDGKLALVREIDLDFVSELPNGEKVTNLVRMQKGYAPIEAATGKAYQLHHINQKMDGTLAILTEAEHQGNSRILNLFGKESEIDRAAFEKIRKEFWKNFAEGLL